MWAGLMCNSPKTLERLSSSLRAFCTSAFGASRASSLMVWLKSFHCKLYSSTISHNTVHALVNIFARVSGSKDVSLNLEGEIPTPLITRPLKRLNHGQKCLHSFSDPEAYHEQMASIPSWYGSLDLAHCAYLEPLVRHFSDRWCNRIGLESGN